ncbi:hypothetical protein FDP41_008576 [Naegleria fowleri]|uniref:Uncharacterized protein n=1 Tax=Naegleria fowleri TaxID=5763 RepID=A0A6A5BKI5_NAEFO|nr:uncharacterized protein FDP41_008576 [Naegleria fowleri]KAF0973369.1 hypothetical protein FDP41_008576 [Naegleria fowleri]CAG4716571.1 unnamed protein product [Naegleria fowleri]
MKNLTNSLSSSSSSSITTLSPFTYFRIKYNQSIKSAPLFRYLFPLGILSVLISYVRGVREYNRNVEMHIPYDVYKFSIKVTKKMVQELMYLKNQHPSVDWNNSEFIHALIVNCFDNAHSRLMCQYMLDKYGNEIIKEVLNSNNHDPSKKEPRTTHADEVFSNLFSKIDYANVANEYFHQYVQQTPLTSSYLAHDWKYRMYRIVHGESD